MKKRLIIFGISIFSLITIIIFLYSSTYIIKIYDFETKAPISGAKVTIDFSYGWDRHIEKESLSNSHGRVFINTYKMGVGMIKRLESITVEKSGYHPNGINSYQIKNNHNYSIFLKRIKNPQNLIVKNIRFYKNDKADFLTAIKKDNYSDIRNIPPSIISSEIDFDFPEISSKFSQANYIGGFYGNIRFYGGGGVQKISSSEETHSSYDKEYALENTLEAPQDGYVKELTLLSGAEYVARLRDGLHYFKFTPFFFKSSSGESYVEIQFYLQPKEGTNLEMNGIALSASSNDLLTKNIKLTKNTKKDFKIIKPNREDIYCVESDIPFYGIAHSNSVVDLKVPSDNISISVNSDEDGYWYANLSGVSYYINGPSIFTKRIVFSNQGKEDFIDVNISKECNKNIIMNYGFFSIEIPSYFNVKLGSINNNKINMLFNRSDIDNMSKDYYNNSISLSIMKGSEKDLNLKIYDLSRKNLEDLKYEIGGLVGYKTKESEYDSSSYLFFYKDERIIQIRDPIDVVIKNNINIIKSLKAIDF